MGAVPVLSCTIPTSLPARLRVGPLLASAISKAFPDLRFNFLSKARCGVVIAACVATYAISSPRCRRVVNVAPDKPAKHRQRLPLQRLPLTGGKRWDRRRASQSLRPSSSHRDHLARHGLQCNLQARARPARILVIQIQIQLQLGNQKRDASSYLADPDCRSRSHPPFSLVPRPLAIKYSQYCP